MRYAGSPRQAEEAVTSAAPEAPPEAPSWSRVLATTLSLWTSRRLHGLRRPRRVLLLVICVLIVAVAAVGVVRLTATSSRSARVSSSAPPHQVRPNGSAGGVGSAGTRGPAGPTSPGGAARYQAALAADLAARRSAGAQLLHSRRIDVSAQGAGQLQANQLRAGQVDSRLLVMLALLASQRSWRVIAFGDASPRVPLAEAPFRQVVITGAGGPDGVAGLAAALALVRAQRAPYQPAQVTTVHLADGQAGLRIDFAAPSPLGLLTGGA